METAICSRLALSPTRVIHPKPGEEYALQKQWTSRSNVRTVPIAGVGKGGGVLNKPFVEKTTPGRESEFDLKKSKLPPYRVLLHNDNYNKREYMVQVLMKVIPGMTLDNADTRLISCKRHTTMGCPW